VRRHVEGERSDYSAQLFSSTKGYGLQELYGVTDRWLQIGAVSGAGYP
jgi:hypothetical protein